MVPRFTLFRKYAATLMLLVGAALVVAGLSEMALGYETSMEATGELQRSEVRTAAVRIEQYLDGIQSQLLDVSGLPWASGLMGLQDRRDEFHRLMKLVPAVSELRSFDAGGRQRVKASRIELDEIDGGAHDPPPEAVLLARARGVYYSPTYFKDATEPYMTLAVRDKDSSSVTVAEINLKFVGEVASQIRVGKAGQVYVVDSADHVVAHPNLSLVLRKTDLSTYPPIKSLREASQGGREPMGMVRGRGLGGDDTMLSAAYIPTSGWLVVVEQPRAEVLEPVYKALTRTALLMVGGLLAALAVGYFLARRLARPVIELRRGAEKLAGGDLSTRIEVRTGDEVEALAHEFNRMADQLQEYTTDLERKVAQKTAQLEMANRHKSEFLANMSHELRTPLNAIIGFSEVLKERMFGELNDKQMEYAADIYGSGQHLLSLINDILDLSKVEAGHMRLDVLEFDVGAAVDNCATLVRERAQRNGLKLTCHVDSDLSRWKGDERKFKQVVINLLTNAVKFTPNGGRIRLRAEREGKWLALSVSDTGVGIAAEYREAIFREFQQIPRGGAAKHEGTGLGLALTRRLVELHHGTLTLESEPGKGSVFTARFPSDIPGEAHA
ncbi:MAG: sensor histidine kinase [Usitatibacter sp.]